MDADRGQKSAEKGVQSAHGPVEDVPDPDEGDLDDLDDMLDEFSAAKISQSQSVTSESAKPAPGGKPKDGADTERGAFAENLQEQMAAFLGEMGESPEAKKELEAIMKDISSDMDPESAPGSEVPTKPEESFQKTIRKTVERMQSSNDQATSTGHSEDSNDFLAQMLKELQDGEVPANGNGEGFNKMLLGMMEQLTNKEILYDPMKELHDKFPSWLERNRRTTKLEEMTRYEQQQKLVDEIVARFERKEYSDASAADRDFIVDRMQQMQAAGNPPAELVGDMEAADVMNNMNTDSCPQQ